LLVSVLIGIYLDFQIESEYDVLIMDVQEQKYQYIGRYPFKSPLLVK
jgi:hypothetical protein